MTGGTDGAPTQRGHTDQQTSDAWAARGSKPMADTRLQCSCTPENVYAIDVTKGRPSWTFPLGTLYPRTLEVKSLHSLVNRYLQF